MRRYFVTTVSVVGLAMAATAALWIAHAEKAEAHCQVPCGIYDDAARITHMHEDVTTITKAIAQINELSGKHDAQSLNQAVRWINVKEAHASNVIEIVSEYFLTQKVKPVAPGAEGYDAYLKSLADHHAVMVAAIKTKQNTEASYAEALDKTIDALAAHYKK